MSLENANTILQQEAANAIVDGLLGDDTAAEQVEALLAAEKAYGEYVDSDGRHYGLTQRPYATGRDGHTFYEAHGFDSKTKPCKLTWEIIDGREDSEDESEVCDWDDFEVWY